MPTLKQILKLGQKVLNHPLHNPDTDLSDTFYEEEAKKRGYVVYAENVPAPLEVEPGAVVVCDYEGMPAKWINGNIYVRKDVLEKHNKTP